jgi:hypothetical protein
MTCQQNVESGSDLGSQHSAVACAASVFVYRQCARGCGLEIGYCNDHGGDDRASEEMVAHHRVCERKKK